MSRVLKLIHASIFIVSSAFSSITFAAPSEFLVHHHAQNSYVNFPNVPRLDQAVLSILHNNKIDSQNIDWLTSSLFDLSSPYEFRRRVMSMVSEQVDLSDDSEDKVRWSHLLTQLERWQYSKRIFLPVDPDITSLNKEYNPNLAGKWLLDLNENSHSVWVLGQVDKPGEYQWHHRTSARQYIKEASWQSYDEFVYVIQPDGKVEKHSVVYWDNGFLEVAPGATIFVPMPFVQSPLHPEYTANNPNEMIVELLRNRIQ